MQEFPKMLYRGTFHPELGLTPLEKVTVGNAKEQKAQVAEGFVTADDIEILIPQPEKKARAKKTDDSEE